MVSVIGAGFGRTGTLSTKQALEQLGVGRCYHMSEVFGRPDDVAVWHAAARREPVDWHAFLAEFGATIDWPSCAFYREQMDAFPDAKVLLTVRDAGRWYDSVTNTILEHIAGPRPDDPNMGPWWDMVQAVITQGTFDGDVGRDHMIEVYERHNAEVQATVPAERLLVFEAAQGWGPLCEFLGVPVPDEPFPNVNTTEEFQARRR
jgi:hypothetical protein